MSKDKFEIKNNNFNTKNNCSNQIEMCFSSNQSLSKKETEAKVVNINLISEKKQSELINLIISNTPSF
jgi:uncharacterized protein (DUF2344 family)